MGISGGTRAAGFGYVGDPRGGFGFGLRDFWQSHPAQLDIRGAATDQAEVTVWLWSPEAQPMDLRFYHDGLGQDTYAEQLEGLEITYEDYEPGFGNPHGIARTHELTLFAYDATPARRRPRRRRRQRILGRRRSLQASPEYLHSARVFGDWAPVDRSTAGARRSSRTSWTSSSTSTPARWSSAAGTGSGTSATSCTPTTPTGTPGATTSAATPGTTPSSRPDLWLWYAYLRSGRADVFRFAEAMTRHTGEVDVYHLGEWRGLGSRHNVQHWGCSAKQLRISTPAYRRFYYYLTADERTGDLLSELVDSDENFLVLDPVRKVRPDSATYRPERHALGVGLGTDWGAPGRRLADRVGADRQPRAPGTGCWAPWRTSPP